MVFLVVDSVIIYSILLLGIGKEVCALETLDFASPPIIKTPQLIGIIAGCIVFSITISVVFYLLYASGSFAKLAEELRESGDGRTVNSKVESNSSTLFASQPELYDELIKARSTLPQCLEPPVLTGPKLDIKLFDRSRDTAALVAASDGRAIFGESAYDPIRLWGWQDMHLDSKGTAPPEGSALNFANTTERYLSASTSVEQNGCLLKIVDRLLDTAIGMMSLSDNCPRNLSIRIGM